MSHTDLPGARRRQSTDRFGPREGGRVAILLVLSAAGAALSAMLAWSLLVPGFLSNAAFLWLIGLGMLATLTTGVTAARARATRSVAHVLYDTEHPVVRGR